MIYKIENIKKNVFLKLEIYTGELCTFKFTYTLFKLKYLIDCIPEIYMYTMECTCRCLIIISS